ncbi:thioredoxin family protein [Billgrantia sp. LNSP4103-1]|uniref:thioredoxin family protein n=1 Tax=Billgrantia sp. LNSP4103-1 TaxID=3410266 RepID=UPI00403F0708
MPMQREYMTEAPSPEQVRELKGLTVIEFGTPWCGFCLVVQPGLERALAQRDEVRHLKIEDGPGRRLGRIYRVKLWPTLVFLQDGEEVARLVRPASGEVIEETLERIAG